MARTTVDQKIEAVRICLENNESSKINAILEKVTKNVAKKIFDVLFLELLDADQILPVLSLIEKGEIKLDEEKCDKIFDLYVCEDNFIEKCSLSSINLDKENYKLFLNAAIRKGWIKTAQLFARKGDFILSKNDYLNLLFSYLDHRCLNNWHDDRKLYNNIIKNFSYIMHNGNFNFDEEISIYTYFQSKGAKKGDINKVMNLINKYNQPKVDFELSAHIEEEFSKFL